MWGPEDQRSVGRVEVRSEREKPIRRARTAASTQVGVVGVKKWLDGRQGALRATGPRNRLSSNKETVTLTLMINDPPWQVDRGPVPSLSADNRTVNGAVVINYPRWQTRGDEVKMAGKADVSYDYSWVELVVIGPMEVGAVTSDLGLLPSERYTSGLYRRWREEMFGERMSGSVTRAEASADGGFKQRIDVDAMIRVDDLGDYVRIRHHS